jgi:hypothetical protein
MKLMTAELRKKLPKLGEQEKEVDPMVYLKLFAPWGGSTWFITEFDGDDLMFGFVRLNDWNDLAELGYISLSELERLRIGPLQMKIERDLYFEPRRLSECKSELGLMP